MKSALHMSGAVLASAFIVAALIVAIAGVRYFADDMGPLPDMPTDCQRAHQETQTVIMPVPGIAVPLGSNLSIVEQPVTICDEWGVNDGDMP